ncbi:peptidoglycan DD-metalloendopeptidase family protein [Candidatus Peregrinibacteria bacterium]|nr:peptidoglycan DD-metalloendopeptidase family protein [Candidatus Peregrinibacteria bacterium]
MFANSLGLQNALGSKFSAKVEEKTAQIKSVLSPYLHGKRKEANESHTVVSNKLFKRYTFAVAVLFLIGSFTPLSLSAEGYYNNTATNVDASMFATSLLADNDGYLTKINPQTNDGDRSNMNDMYVHTVKPGETLSTIANGYGVKTNTVMWANNLSNANSIKAGQEIAVPPVDGVAHKVAKGENLEKIAQKYSVEAESIRKQNKLLASVVEGENIFIPGAKPIVPEPRVVQSRSVSSSRVAVGTPVALAGSTDAPTVGKIFIRPTRGIITQGYKRGHYALDIADASKPPVWAAGSGSVIKASSGTWGGGYGNHVIIDHGNGMQTLYAHLDYLDVSVGDNVSQGAVIGRMGRTGRVYGRTGIHLHFEVRKNGVKQNPAAYY